MFKMQVNCKEMTIILNTQQLLLMKSCQWKYCFRITDPTGPTETSIAPRQRPKANSSTAASSVLTIQSSATPVKVQVPGVFGNRGQKGNVPMSAV